MRSSLCRAALTAATTGLLGMPLRALLIHAGLFDVPNHRSSHSTPIPRGGGAAPLTAAALVGAVGPRPSGRTTGAVLGLAAVGLADDVSGHVPALARLGAQLVAGGALGTGPGAAFASVGTTGIVNVVNFMDGINGISGGAGAVWGANALTLAAKPTDELAILGALVLGGSLGFLPHNAPRARFFLGDLGSYSLGAAMAAGVFSRRRLADQWCVASPLLLYGLDAAHALIHRVRTRQALGVAHRDHVYQRLVDSGIPHAKVAAFHAGLAALVALAHHGQSLRWRVLGTTVASAVYLCAPRLVGTTEAGRAA